MFGKLLNMFINRDDLSKRDEANLADVLEPARPGEADPSILKTISDAVPEPDFKDDLDETVQESKQVHDEDSKKEEHEDNAAEQLRDELFKKFKLK